MEYIKRKRYQFRNLPFIIAGLFLFAIMSCTKLSNNILAPTIISFSPISDSANISVTIIGTHLSGTIAVSFGGTAARSFHVISDSIVTAVVDSGTTGWIMIITPGGTATFAGFTFLARLPLIDSIYSNSNQVDSAYLIAHWTFDSTSAEVISNTFGKSIDSVTYTAGQIGYAATFTDGGFIYAPIPNLNSANAMRQYTISMWVNIAANDTADYPLNKGRESSLFQINSSNNDNVYGLAALEVQSNEGYSGDTLALGGELTQIITNVTNDTTATLDPRINSSQFYSGAGRWAFVVETYNDETQIMNIYGDSVLYLSKTMSNISFPFLLNPNGSNQVTIGTFEFKDDGFVNAPSVAAATDTTSTDAIYWAHGITGSLDDIRVFNKILTQHEIADLYLLGLQNR